MNLKIHIDTISYNQKPTPDKVASLKPRLQKTKPVDISLKELAVKISKGYSERSKGKYILRCGHAIEYGKLRMVKG